MTNIDFAIETIMQAKINFPDFVKPRIMRAFNLLQTLTKGDYIKLNEEYNKYEKQWNECLNWLHSLRQK